MIDVSVVIPYFNERSTIKTTLNLIASQSFKPREVIFVNSSSTDNSSDIIDTWIESQIDIDKIRYLNITSKSTTPSSSKNIGIINSNSDWIAFMDCGLSFSQKWLEVLVDHLQKNDFKPNIVSGVCRLKGSSRFDICAVAHTYGVGTNRVCIPGSIVNKEVFDLTGLFLDNMRASYDRAWQIKTRNLNINRITPQIHNVAYIGINFSQSSSSLIRKVIMYSRPAVKVDGYYVPFIYVLFAILLIYLLLTYPAYGWLAVFCYIIFRGYCLPLYKSNDKNTITRSMKNILLLPYVGILIDISRLCGYALGFASQLLGNNKKIK